MKTLITAYLFIFPFSITAQTYVDIGATGGSNDGTSWINA